MEKNVLYNFDTADINKPAVTDERLDICGQTHIISLFRSMQDRKRGWQRSQINTNTAFSTYSEQSASTDCGFKAADLLSVEERV